jgi:hypothetical protein
VQLPNTLPTLVTEKEARNINNMLKSLRMISRINAELDISSVSAIRVDVVSDHLWVIFIPVCQTNVSFYEA